MKSKSGRGKLEILISFLLAVITTWAVCVLTVYILDLPSQGGPDKYCESFYIKPDNPSHSTYLYKNTFNISSMGQNYSLFSRVFSIKIYFVSY